MSVNVVYARYHCIIVCRTISVTCCSSVAAHSKPYVKQPHISPSLSRFSPLCAPHSRLPLSSAGDAVEVKDYVTQESALIPLAGPANRQGRIAADNIAGRSSTFRGSQGTSVLGLFGTTLAGTGASEKTLKRVGRPHKKVRVWTFGAV